MIILNKIIIATQNTGKIAEFKSLFKELGIEVLSLLDYPNLADVEETGTTFEENARIKAETIAKELKTLVLADDSGLCIEALNGEPGVYSARYAGTPSNSEKNIDKVLKELEGIENRRASFICCLALAYPDKESLIIEGRVDGHIVNERTGELGFGYDPIFFYPPYNQTFAQMGKDEKNKVSHRSLALKALLDKFPKYMEGVRGR